jgi:hypothetical protein
MMAMAQRPATAITRLTQRRALALIDQRKMRFARDVVIT